MTNWPRPPDGSPIDNAIDNEAPTASVDIPDAAPAAGTAATNAVTEQRTRTGPSGPGGAARRLVTAVTGIRPAAGTRPPVGPGAAGSAATAPPTDRGTRTSADPAEARRGPRRARLALRRIDPWSVLKVAFLLSLAMLVVFIVAVGVLYLVLDTMGVFSSIDSALQQVSSATNPTSVAEVFSFSRAVGGAAVLGAVNVLLFTALATLGAFLYNICATIAGGIEVTLTE